MTPDCYVVIDGERFADTAAELATTPVALADVDLNWGRGNTVDQPAPATCRIAVLDRLGGAVFADQLEVGRTLELHATGDIGSAAEPANIAVDGSFETLALGDPGNRVAAGEPGGAVVVGTPTFVGYRAIRAVPVSLAAINVQVPPAAFTPGDLTGWDAIPRLALGQTWEWSLAVRGAPASAISVRPVFYTGPEHARAGMGPDSVPVTATGAGTWQTIAGSYTVTESRVGTWLGLYLGSTPAGWDDLTGTWTATTGTWADYTPAYFDDQRILAPPSAVRDVLVFAGRITDLAARLNRDGSVRVEVTAVDQLADLENRYVGDEPWPAETLTVRVGRIASASGADVDVRVDDPLGALFVSWRDVDNQAAGALFAELAASVDGVLWSASHATTGAYLWIENVTLRAQVGVLELVGAFVTIVVDTESGRPPGKTVIDGCQIPTEPLTWIRDVTDVLTRIDVTWLEQTTSEGLPAPTERRIRVLDSAAELEYGVRRMGLSTQLTSSADAIDVGNRILGRTRSPQGRVDGLTWDLGRYPPTAGEPMGAALDLLDGTTRLGRGLVVENADLWPGGDTMGLYLDGGRYTFDAAGWTLGLIGTPLVGMGESAEWNDLDPTWDWAQMDPTLEWPDLYGVAGPLAETRT